MLIYTTKLCAHTQWTHTQMILCALIFEKDLIFDPRQHPGITSPKLKSFHAEMSDLTSTFDNYVTRLRLSLYVSVRRGRWDNLHHIFGAPQGIGMNPSGIHQDEHQERKQS